jgi:acetylornithine deacetylase
MTRDRLKSRVIEKLERQAPETLELASRLVRTPSVSFPPSGDEAACQELIRDYLGDMGLVPDLFYPEEVPGFPDHPLKLADREYDGRPVVAARLPGTGSQPAFIFSGHVDTVPPAKGAWTGSPFSGEVKEGRLYGLGAYDMKGGLAAELAAVRCLRELGLELPGDVIFESVIDEEYAGCGGTLAARLRGYTGGAVLLAEPSGMNLYPAHRGYRMAHLTLSGQSGIGLSGEAINNPIRHAGRLAGFCDHFQQIRNEDHPASDYYDTEADPVPVMATKLACGSFEAVEPITIPGECKLEVYWQTLPGESREEIDTQFQAALESYCHQDAVLKENRPEVEYVIRWIPGTSIPPDHHLVRTVAEGSAAVLGTAPEIKGAPFPCDMFIFNDEFGIPGVILGPGGAGAHAPDEYVEVSDLIKLSQIYALSVIGWFGLDKTE